MKQSRRRKETLPPLGQRIELDKLNGKRLPHDHTHEKRTASSRKISIPTELGRNVGSEIEQRKWN